MSIVIVGEELGYVILVGLGDSGGTRGAKWQIFLQEADRAGDIAIGFEHG